MHSPLPRATDVLDDPHWLCIGFERAARRLHFLRVTDEILEQTVFVDPRRLADCPRITLPLHEIPKHADANATSAGGLILHTAFACSTLLARSVDAPPQRRVLRELPVFSGLPVARLELDATEWTQLCSILPELVSRPFTPGGICHNKPSNSFLPVAGDWLAASPRSRAVVIDTPLDDFLLSAAKRQAAGLAPWLTMWRSLDPGGQHAAHWQLQPEQLDPLRLAGFLWHLQMHLLHALGRQPIASRLRRVSAEAFLASPLAVAGSVAHWLGGQPHDGVNPAHVERIMQRDAKRPGAVMNPALRLRSAEALRAEVDRPLREAKAWCAQQFGSHLEARAYPIQALDGSAAAPA